MRTKQMLGLEHVVQKWDPVLRKKTCDIKNLEWVA
jgi:hypothetical protein